MSGPTKVSRRKVLLRRERAEREAQWFFGTLGGRVPEEGACAPSIRAAALTIDGWLRMIPAFHRGALALAYVPRTWPAAIRGWFGEFTSLVVRLECALHPTPGQTNEALEAASVARLSAALASGGRTNAKDAFGPDDDDLRLAAGPLGTLFRRALRHRELAIHALARARGDGACVVPRGRARSAASAARGAGVLH